MDHSQAIIDILATVADADFDLDAFMQSVVETMTRLTRASGAVIELVDGEDMIYRCTSANFARWLDMRLRRKGSLSGRCVEEARVLCCVDTETDDRVDREACRRINVRSMICTPLFQRGAPVGVLKVMAGEANSFTVADEQTLRLMAGTLGAALGKQLAFEAKDRIEAELRSSRSRLQASEARRSALLQHASDAIVSMDCAGLVTGWNTAAEELFGWTAYEAIGREVAELVVPEHLRTAHRTGLARFLSSGKGHATQQRMEMRALHRCGRELIVEMSLSAVLVDGEWEFLAVLHCIAERKRQEIRMQQLALEDSLTGLANRRGFIGAVEQAVARAQRHRHSLAILYMDLNGFKRINDVHGHEAGDLALVEFAKRLRVCVRRSDLAARLGGDEFAVLGEGIATMEQAQALAEKIRDALVVPMEDPAITLRTSIGIALFDGHGGIDALLRAADKAMYEDKRRAREAIASL